MKVYSVSYRYQSNAWCKFTSLDEDAIKVKIAELDSNNDYTRGSLVVEDVSSPLYMDDTMFSRFDDFIVGSAIFVGERHVDARCTGMRRFYTHPDYLEEANKEFYKSRLGQNTAADRYYAQPWV